MEALSGNSIQNTAQVDSVSDVLLSPRVSKHDCRPGSEEFSPKCLRRAATPNPGAS